MFNGEPSTFLVDDSVDISKRRENDDWLGNIFVWPSVTRTSRVDLNGVVSFIGANHYTRQQIVILIDVIVSAPLSIYTERHREAQSILLFVNRRHGVLHGVIR